MRMLGMRRTMWVAPVATASVVQAGATRGVAATQRRRYVKLVRDGGLGDADWLAGVEAETLAALLERGAATGAELSAAVPRLRSKVLLSPGKKYEQEASITTWVLLLLAADGHAVRGRPRGTWVSSQYAWVPAQTWLDGGFADIPVDRARADLVRSWLRAFGPATFDDLRWWTGWGVGETRQALTGVDTAEVALDDGTTGLLLADDLEPVVDPGPWVALLPSLDATTMGWKARGWYLGDHGPRLFDRNGNAGPTVWCDGRVVGGWAQRPGGEIAVHLLEDTGAEARAAIDAEAGALRDWVGDVRFLPRFRTPLERELSAA